MIGIACPVCSGPTVWERDCPGCGFNPEAFVGAMREPVDDWPPIPKGTP